MAGFDDFADNTVDVEPEAATETEVLHVMNVEYEEQFGDPLVHMWCRTEDDEPVHVEVEGHRPSFYVRDDDYTHRVKNHHWVDGHEHRDEDGERWRTLYGEPLTRVFTQLPKHIGGTDNEKGLREYFDSSWEADIFFTNRFLIDTGIRTHIRVDLEETWEPQVLQGDYRVDVEGIEPAHEDVEWRATPRMITIDIEVASPDGFPEPEDAEQPVTVITAHDNYSDAYTVWLLRHPDHEMSDTEMRNLCIEERPDGTAVEDVFVYDTVDEKHLLDDFNNWVADRSPDLLSGWNSSTMDHGGAFDYPYLINRSKKLNVYSFEKWSPMDQVWTSRWGPRAKGVEMFDMLKAYEKTQWSKPKGGWGLDNIAHKELGLGKAEMDDIDTAWRDELGTFLKYNIRDVQAVVDIDTTVGVLDLFQNLRALTGAQYGDCHNNIDLLDVLILRYAHEMGVALPTNEEPDRGWYYGAHVFTPEFGRHPNVVYPDLWSMYPNMIRNANMSPETLIGTAADLEASDYSEEDCRWTYIDTRATNVKREDDPDYEKVYFLKPSIKEGFMTGVVNDLMGMKSDYKGTDLYAAVKRVVNSVYGVYGDSDSYGKGYRLFDWRIAEGICLGGRKMIQDSSDRYVEAINAIKDERGIEGQKAYRVGGDTDSVMTAIPFMDVRTDEDVGDATTTVTCVDKGEMEVPLYYEDYSDIVDVALDAADRVNEWYNEWTEETFNITEGRHFCELEIESYAPWAFIPYPATNDAEGKKRYAEIIAWEEGEWFDPPEFSVTGIDIVRSDRAEATRDTAQKVLDTTLRVDDPTEARRKVYDIIDSTVAAIEDGEKPRSYIARPRGMGKKPESYGSPTNTPMPTYRGAKYANQNFDWCNMKSGAKPQLLYIEKVRGDWPRTYTADTKEDGDPVDAVAAEEPNKIPEDFVVDTDKMIEKVLKDPLDPLLGPMNWSFEEALADTEQGDLSTWM